MKAVSWLVCLSANSRAVELASHGGIAVSADGSLRGSRELSAEEAREVQQATAWSVPADKLHQQQHQHEHRQQLQYQHQHTRHQWQQQQQHRQQQLPSASALEQRQRQRVPSVLLNPLLYDSVAGVFDQALSQHQDVSWAHEAPTKSQLQPQDARWQGSSFECVPRSTLAVGAWSIMSLLGLSQLCLRCGCALDTPMPDPDVRNIKMDNAKFLAMAFVVSAHMSFFSLGYSKMPAAAWIEAVWFHMPMFALISGANSRTVLTRQRLERILIKTAAPTVMFCFFVWPSFAWLTWRLCGLPGEQDFLGFAATYGRPIGSLLQLAPRWDLAWYLRCLLLWKLSAQLLDVLPRWLQCGIVMSIGIMSSYSQSSEAFFVRACSMFPLFFLGRCLNWDLLCLPAKWQHRHRLLLVVSWMALISLLCCHIVFHDTSGQLLHSVEDPTTQFQSFRSLLTLNCPADIWFLWLRYLGDLSLRAGMALLFYICCVPDFDTYYTGAGRRTIYAYLLHIPVVLIPASPLLQQFCQSWSWELMRQQEAVSLQRRLLGCILASTWLLLSFGITFVLTSSPMCKLFRWAVEPTWLQVWKLQTPHADDAWSAEGEAAWTRKRALENKLVSKERPTGAEETSLRNDHLTEKDAKKFAKMDEWMQNRLHATNIAASSDDWVDGSHARAQAAMSNQHSAKHDTACH
eukprot:TRINITY_DN11986_c0_g1_i1.p1 TRINITY_DN11986_c0_g1~~TRINITY_DN11986_c0_g1_i1.p1  ORF type:complete len:686 (-),score=111.12 TRINITY_DN11986_c0_g1_i1:140-2197(-)